MKKLILILVLCMFSFVSEANDMKAEFKKVVNTTIHLGPCDITINGTISGTLVPPAITGFSGSITFGTGCVGTVSGTWGLGMLVTHNSGGIIDDVQIDIPECSSCESYIDNNAISQIIEWLINEESNL